MGNRGPETTTPPPSRRSLASCSRGSASTGLTVRDVARRFRVSKDKVRGWIDFDASMLRIGS
jgi:hypothetical protein